MLRAGDIIDIKTADGGIRRFRLTDDIGAVVDGVCHGVHGGMGQVIGARELVGNSLSGEPMVVKVVNHGAVERTARDQDRTLAEALQYYENALEREAAFLTAVRAAHPDPHTVNIVKIECGGRFREPRTGKTAPILVIERCDFTLARVLKGGGEGDPRLARVLEYVRSLPGALALARQGAAALNALARLPGDDGGIITHRDFKPSNILIVCNKLSLLYLAADFGTVKTHHADGTHSLCLGTPDYRAPEIAQAERTAEKDRFIDYAAADSFSLGVVLFECLTGKLPVYPVNPGGLSPECPFVLNDAERQALRQAIENLPARIQGGDETIVAGDPDADRRGRAVLFKLIEDCLRRRPGDRPKAAEILTRLTAWRTGAPHRGASQEAPPKAVAETAAETIVVRPASAARQPGPPPARSRRVQRMAGVIAGLLAMTGVGWVATGGAMAPATPVPVRFVAPAPGLGPEPARWSGGYKDAERPLCRVKGANNGEGVLPAGERLVFSARFGDEKSWRSPPRPVAVVIPEYGPVQAAAPGVGQCGKPLGSGGAPWGCTMKIAGSGRAALALLADGEASASPQAVIEAVVADVERRFPSGPGPRPVEAIARALAAAAPGGAWTTFRLGGDAAACGRP